MNIYITGNRVQDLGGFQENLLQGSIKKQIVSTLKKHKKEDPTTLITTLSLGIEQWAAEAAIQCKIPFHVYIPCKGFETKWIKYSQLHYKKLLKLSEKIIKISDAPWSIQGMKLKDERIIKDVDIIYTFANQYLPINTLARKAKKEKINLLEKIPAEQDDYFIII